MQMLMTKLQTLYIHTQLQPGGMGSGKGERSCAKVPKRCVEEEAVWVGGFCCSVEEEEGRSLPPTFLPDQSSCYPWLRQLETEKCDS